MIVTANGTFAYNTDWNGIERAKRPDAISLIGRACGLNPDRTYKPLRLLREHSGVYLRKLWQLSLRTADQGTARAFSSRTTERTEQSREKVRPVRAVMQTARILWAFLCAT